MDYKYGKKKKKRIGRPPNTLSLLVDSKERRGKFGGKKPFNNVEKAPIKTEIQEEDLPIKITPLNKRKKRRSEFDVLSPSMEEEEEIFDESLELKEENLETEVKRIKEEPKVKPTIKKPEPVLTSEKLSLQSDPIKWTVDDVVNFMIDNDCKYVVPFLREQVRFNITFSFLNELEQKKFFINKHLFI